MKSIDIAIAGFGGIGRHVARLLHDRQARYRDHFGTEVRITGVCGSSAGLCDAQGLDPTRLADASGFTTGLTGEAFMAAVQAEVLFEASPTNFRTGGAARGYIIAALERGMHVVAISKGALALDYAGLHGQALRQGVELKISGATSSALPTIDLLQYNFAGCEVLSVEAILTGTTNVILSQMADRQCSFEDALAEAQRLGIAESDPSLDVDGWDTACKLTILANAAFGAGIDVQAMPREGIGHLGAADIRAWRARGLMPRLVGCIDRTGGQTRASVVLRLYASEHPFARVHGGSKAIHVVTDLMGEFTMSGGGSNPVGTAAAALKDFEHILAGLR